MDYATRVLLLGLRNRPVALEWDGQHVLLECDLAGALRERLLDRAVITQPSLDVS